MPSPSIISEVLILWYFMTILKVAAVQQVTQMDSELDFSLEMLQIGEVIQTI